MGWKSGQSIILFSATIIVLSAIHAWRIHNGRLSCTAVAVEEK
jgi:hypothetical protein